MSLITTTKEELEKTQLAFGCDLLGQANKLFDLLESFADFIKQYSQIDLEDKIQEGFRDYALFMKLQHEHPTRQLVPTTMIDLIWVSHALRNEMYAQDCKRKFGRTLLRPMEFENRMKQFKETEMLWKEFYRFPYTEPPPLFQMVDLSWISLTPMQVLEDTLWLPALVAIHPDYRNRAFLQRQMEYYQKILYIWTHYMFDQTSGPHVGIDIFWHAHILSPTYEEDCTRLVGMVPSHFPKSVKPSGRSVLRKQINVHKIKSETDLDDLFVREFGVRMSFSLTEIDPNAFDPFNENMLKEVFNLVLNNLGFFDLLAAAGVNKKWRSGVQSASKWRQLYGTKTNQEAFEELPSPEKFIHPARITEHAYDHQPFMELYLALINVYRDRSLKQTQTPKSKRQWYSDWEQGIKPRLLIRSRCSRMVTMK